jgi:transcriptional regulator with PAS, ATPase and Fis domain
MANLQSIKQRFGIIGSSELLDRALHKAVAVASSDLSVMINGESGVGKEVFSKIIHSLSARKHNNFFAINCGAIPAGTINSELFGHEKGAFTGASTERKGYFETVDGGTIFLDEIGEMPLDTQAYLLRILENGEYVKVGSSKVLKTDVRVIAATNVDLEEKMRTGKFRQDLYYRLNTVPIDVPALRERPEDIYKLFRYFTVDFAERNRMRPINLDERAQLLLANYEWPGNIRELKNIAEQISVLSEERNVTAQDLMDYLPNIGKRNLPVMSSGSNSAGSNFEEREILYKLLFEMKKDVRDLKGLVYGLIQNNDLAVPTGSQVSNLPSLPERGSNNSSYYQEQNIPTYPREDFAAPQSDFSKQNFDFPNNRPVIIDESNQDSYHQAEVVEDSLSLEEMEKNLIRKALKKHNNRRKEAADDLGISERTLYRKIKEYEI